MINPKRNRFVSGLFVALLMLMVVTLLAQVSSASNEPIPNAPAQVFAVPTPITTPSSLDALSTTSDVIVGGNSTIAGTLGVTGALTASGGQTNSNWFAVAAPTGIATATPAFVVNSAGVSNLFEARKNTTPVASIDGTGVGTFANGLTVTTGTVALPASEIGATEIANLTRAIKVSIRSLFECTTDAGAAIAFTDAADAHPHYVNSATNGLGAVLRFDDTGGSPDTDYVCGDLMVPPDYASGGAFIVRALKDAVTGANTEILNCAGSINGAALGTGGTVTITTAASTAYTCTPTLSSLAANDSVSFEFHITSSGTVDDITDIAAIEFTYTSTQ